MNNDLIKTTPIGTSEFCWLTEPDMAFNKNDGKGEYQCSVVFTKAEGQEHKKAINDAIAKLVADIHKKTPGIKDLKRSSLPYREEGDKITFKFKSKFKPRLYDRDAKELGADISVWKGSTMKVRYKLNTYNLPIGVGCTLYLQDVQIVDLIKGSPQNGASPFKKIDGSSLPAKELY